MKNKGFTLIELLVVVLIIGILASIALPQYYRAVTKAKFSQADVIVDAAKKDVQLYLAARGWPHDNRLWLTGTEGDVGDIELPGNCNSCSGELFDSTRCCETESVTYSVEISEEEAWIILYFRFLDNVNVIISRKRNDNGWAMIKLASYDENNTKAVCRWAQERNIPATGQPLEACAGLNIPLEEY